MHSGARLMDGEVLAAGLRRQMAARRHELGPVSMVSVLVGEDAASLAYLGRKHQDCAEIGVAARLLRLPASCTEAELLAVVQSLNADPAVDGFFVQFPLPPGLSEARVAAAIAPEKDIDGLHPVNLGRLLAGLPGLRPCTPMAVLTLLRGHDVALAGRRVAVIGRGALVGRPLAVLLAAPGVDAVVTQLHRSAGDWRAVTRAADVVISAAGVPGLLRAADLRPGAAVVGVGISYDAAGRMVSDLDPDVASVAGHVTPPDGRVGPLTRAMLLQNLLQAAAARLGRA